MSVAAAKRNPKQSARFVLEPNPPRSPSKTVELLAQKTERTALRDETRHRAALPLRPKLFFDLYKGVLVAGLDFHVL